MSASMKLGSVSEPDVSCATCAYVCLIGNITPANMSNVGCESGHSGSSFHRHDNMIEEVGTSKDEETTIEVQRSAAFHELIESNRKVKSSEDCKRNIEEDDSKTILMPKHLDENSDDDSDDGNPRLLRLTRTEWLSQSRDGSPDARKQSLTPSTSETSSASEDNEPSAADRVLSKVLALDKEHNLFGLSNIMIAGPKVWKKHKEKGSKGIFHQTAIVHICFKQCCKRRSKSDLPTSLKCGGCKSKCSCARCGSCTMVCGSTPCGPPCGTPCATPCSLPCGRPCPSPSPLPCILPCKKPCPPKPCPICPLVGCGPSACDMDCTRFGLQISVIKKPEYEPTYAELEPKSSCILQKPLAARSCHHIPRCLPPSSCFPYLMPCFWPARANAPCCEPSRCFHYPPCPKGRAPRSRIVPEELCPSDHPCAGADNSGKCENYSCIGRNNEALKKALAEKYGGKKA